LIGLAVERVITVFEVLYHVLLFKDNLLNYLLTPWSRILLEKLTGFAASQEIPRIYGT
jgi:hypothetical protein